MSLIVRLSRQKPPPPPLSLDLTRLLFEIPQPLLLQTPNFPLPKLHSRLPHSIGPGWSRYAPNCYSISGTFTRTAAQMWGQLGSESPSTRLLGLAALTANGPAWEFRECHSLSLRGRFWLISVRGKSISVQSVDFLIDLIILGIGCSVFLRF